MTREKSNQFEMIILLLGQREYCKSQSFKSNPSNLFSGQSPADKLKDLKHLRLFSNWILRKGFISNTYNQLLKNPKSIDLKHLRVFSNRTDAQQSKYCKIGLVSNNLSVQFLGELGKDPCKNLYIFCRNWQRNNFPKMMRFYCFFSHMKQLSYSALTDWLTVYDVYYLLWSH